MRFLFGLIVIGLGMFAEGQEMQYPRNYFRHPLDIPMQLVANFGEIRTNHWHMGLDIRTQQRVNLPVYAAAEGFISRVVVEPSGFGQAIYIDHPNGYTTLYAHMNAFFPALAAYVKQQQYLQQSWKINLKFAGGEFPVQKGTLIGLSGSTGASQGPHVHFEVRDTKTANCLNPLLFGFPLPDNVPPTITRLAMYDRTRSTYDQLPQMLALKRAGAGFTVGTGVIITGSNRISFAVGAVDRFTGSANPNGIYGAKVFLDDKIISTLAHNDISYDETRYINAQLDFPYQARGGADLQHLSPLPGARSVAYELGNEDGYVQLNDEELHAVRIEVWDANSNSSVINFQVRYNPSLTKPYAETGAERFLPNNINIFERENFELFTTDHTIYDTVKITFTSSVQGSTISASPLFTFLSAAIPSHDSVTVRIKPSAPAAEGNEKLVIKNTSGSRSFIQRARWQSGWVAAKFRQFGTYQLLIDLQPPTVNAPPANLTKASRIVFTPTDNFDVIRDFRVELDGKWLRFTNDKGHSWIYTFDENFPRGEHELKVIVEDEAGNVTTKVWNVVR